MREKIKNKLVYLFEKKKKRKPNNYELKKINELSKLYERDMNYILEMEIEESF